MRMCQQLRACRISTRCRCQTRYSMLLRESLAGSSSILSNAGATQDLFLFLRSVCSSTPSLTRYSIARLAVDLAIPSFSETPGMVTKGLPARRFRRLMGVEPENSAARTCRIPSDSGHQVVVKIQNKIQA